MRVPDTGARTGDLRVPLLGGAAWAGSLAGRAGGAVALAALLAAAGLLVWLVLRRDQRAALALAASLVLAAALAVAMLHVAEVRSGPVAALADERAVVSVQGAVVADPRPVHGRYGDLVAVRLRVLDVEGRGTRHRLASPVLVLGSASWSRVELGAVVATTGRLAPAEDPDLAGLLVSPSDPRRLEAPSAAWRGAGRVRETIRGAVAHRPPVQRALVPALVDGDDAGLDPEVAEQFRVTGLTHLTAVSGTNLTLVVGFLLAVARGVGVRGRWLPVLGAAGVIGFVLLARTEPSVLRAAVMGSVGLLAMAANGRDRAMRALGTALVVLLLVQPGLAASAGFVLSVLATAGIVLVGPALRDALAAWLPRPLAEAVAVPLAAQLACTPVVAAISGQVSLVAVGANLLVGPVVGPATVLGLLGGLVGLVSAPLSRLLGTPAGWCVGWIVVVAERGADLPLPAVGWGTGTVALVALGGLTLGVCLVAPLVLRRRALTLALALALGVVVLARVPSGLGLPGLGRLGGSFGGWPPEGWVMVACDVGQGDALVLRAGPGSAVVVDAGPDPDAVDGCLRDLGVSAVPLVVLTHFHADHVDGLAGVLRGRAWGRVLTTRVLDPPGGVADVRAATAVRPTRPPSPRGVARCRWARCVCRCCGPGPGR